MKFIMAVISLMGLAMLGAVTWWELRALNAPAWVWIFWIVGYVITVLSGAALRMES